MIILLQSQSLNLSHEIKATHKKQNISDGFDIIVIIKFTKVTKGHHLTMLRYIRYLFPVKVTAYKRTKSFRPI